MGNPAGPASLAVFKGFPNHFRCWLFSLRGSYDSGGPCNGRYTILKAVLGPLILGNSHLLGPQRCVKSCGACCLFNGVLKSA